MATEIADGRFLGTHALERFWQRVDRATQDGCWLWTGARLHRPGADYGRFWTGEREMKAHRFSYELHIGFIPAGLWVLHHCDNPPCVNPQHLFLGTHDDNMADKLAKGRNCYGDRNGSRRFPERRPRGESSPVAVLTDAAARVLHDAYACGRESQAQLALRFGVSRGTVSNIVLAKGRFAWLAS